MNAGVDIQIVRTEYGPFPEAASLNPRIDARARLLRATLDVRWEETDPRPALSRLESTLARFSPSFRLHECRGPRTYHVFANQAPASPAPSGSPAVAASNGFRANLALAHLLEHVAIDCLCAVTGQARCSGVTGELRRHPGRFHVMFESPDGTVGRLCLALAVMTLTEAIRDHAPGPEERALLATAGLAYQHPQVPWTPPALARRLGWPEERAVRALVALGDLGFLREIRATINFSGAPEYRIAFN
jgi:hypothetical protein